MQRLQIDIAALQEIWHPADDSVHIKGYGAPIMKVRTGREGGGVAIYTKNSVKKVHLQQYDVNGLEAVWADVMVDKCRMVVGSVSIAPGDTAALNLLDSTIELILTEHRRLIIAMDSNSRHGVWDDSCIGLPRHTRSLQMGTKLDEIIRKHGLVVHNDGQPTYCQGNVATAPDVTLSVGLLELGPVKWSVVDDELRTPHEGILVSVDEKPDVKIEVIDWPKFDWNKYEMETEQVLSDLCDNWDKQDLLQSNSEILVSELVAGIEQCVQRTATLRTITKHSRPWISCDIANKLKDLRRLKRKWRLRRSPANGSVYKKAVDEVYQEIKQAEKEYWLSECHKLNKMKDQDKWKVIQKLTNQQTVQGVQPLRVHHNGKDMFF